VGRPRGSAAADGFEAGAREGAGQRDQAHVPRGFYGCLPVLLTMLKDGGNIKHYSLRSKTGEQTTRDARQQLLAIAASGKMWDGRGAFFTKKGPFFVKKSFFVKKAPTL
jgi:hypothetical protein